MERKFGIISKQTGYVWNTPVKLSREEAEQLVTSYVDARPHRNLADYAVIEYFTPKRNGPEGFAVFGVSDDGHPGGATRIARRADASTIYGYRHIMNTRKEAEALLEKAYYRGWFVKGSGRVVDLSTL